MFEPAPQREPATTEKVADAAGASPAPPATVEPPTIRLTEKQWAGAVTGLRLVPVLDAATQAVAGIRVGGLGDAAGRSPLRDALRTGDVIVRFQGRATEMTTTQLSGDCNLCHTESGAQGAPGRVVLP